MYLTYYSWSCGCWCCWGCSTCYSYDYLYVRNYAGTNLASYTGNYGTVSYQYTVWDSPTLKFGFVADSTNINYGFRLNFTLG